MINRSKLIALCDEDYLCQYIKNKITIDKHHHYALFIPHGSKSYEQIIVSGINKLKTTRSYSVHAEIDVINKFNKKKNKPRKVDLYIINLTKNGNYSEARPCFHCIIKLIKSKIDIRHVYYSTHTGIHKETFSNMVNTTSYISYGIKRIKNK